LSVLHPGMLFSRDAALPIALALLIFGSTFVGDYWLYCFERPIGSNCFKFIVLPLSFSLFSSDLEIYDCRGDVPEARTRLVVDAWSIDSCSIGVNFFLKGLSRLVIKSISSVPTPVFLIMTSEFELEKASALDLLVSGNFCWSKGKF